MNPRIVKGAGSVLVAVALIGTKLTLRHMARAERAEESAAERAAVQQASAARAPIADGEQGAQGTQGAAGATPVAGQPRTVAQSASLASQQVVPPAVAAPIGAAAAAASAANARTAETVAAAGGAAQGAPTSAADGGPAAPTAAPSRTDDRLPGGRAGRSVSVSVDGSGSEPEAAELTLVRETFSYAGQGRRDPFVSLMENGELRPTLGELRLVGVAYDPSGRGSVAIMRDVGTKEQYRVRVGQALGRMRVARIQQKQVLFTIEEFGFSRQEVLALGDSTTARVK